MRSGTIVMLSGAAAAIVGGAFAWRGWARYKTCETGEQEPGQLCTPLNAPMVTGLILTPIGFGTFIIGGALALIQTSGKGGR